MPFRFLAVRPHQTAATVSHLVLQGVLLGGDSPPHERQQPYTVDNGFTGPRRVWIVAIDQVPTQYGPCQSFKRMFLRRWTVLEMRLPHHTRVRNDRQPPQHE